MNTQKVVLGFALSVIVSAGFGPQVIAQRDTADDDEIEQARNIPETQEEKNFARNQVAHKKGAVGIQFSINKGKRTWPKITGIVVGSPADKAGLKVGDWIMSVRQESTYGLDRESVVFLFCGDSGEEVAVEVKRPPTNDLYTCKCILVDASQLADSKFVEALKKQRGQEGP